MTMTIQARKAPGFSRRKFIKALDNARMEPQDLADEMGGQRRSCSQVDGRHCRSASGLR